MGADKNITLRIIKTDHYDIHTAILFLVNNSFYQYNLSKRLCTLHKLGQAFDNITDWQSFKNPASPNESEILMIAMLKSLNQNEIELLWLSCHLLRNVRRVESGELTQVLSEWGCTVETEGKV